MHKSSAYANVSYDSFANFIIKSLIYKLKDIGEIRLPCKTPLLIFIFTLLFDIFSFAFEYSNLIVPIISSEISCSTNLLKSLL